MSASGITTPLTSSIASEVPRLNELDLVAGFYSILLVSFVMTVFELFFYYFIVFQESRNAVTVAVEGFGEGALYLGAAAGYGAASDPNASMVLATFDPVGTILNPVSTAFWALGEQETKLINHSNFAYIMLGVAILPVLFVLILMVDRRLRKVAAAKGPTVYKTKMKVIWLSVVATVLMLVPFQYLFFLFGAKFRYAGREGIEEIENTFYNSLREDLGLNTGTLALRPSPK